MADEFDQYKKPAETAGDDEFAQFKRKPSADSRPVDAEGFPLVHMTSPQGQMELVSHRDVQGKTGQGYKIGNPDSYSTVDPRNDPHLSANPFTVVRSNLGTAADYYGKAAEDVDRRGL